MALNTYFVNHVQSYHEKEQIKGCPEFSAAVYLPPVGFDPAIFCRNTKTCNYAIFLKKKHASTDQLKL